MKLGSGYEIHQIGPKLRAYRKEKELRLIDLSKAAGVSSAMLSKIENGRIIPTIPTLFQLINVLGVEPQDFFAEINQQGDFSGYLLVRQENYVPYVKEESAVGFHYQSIFEHTLDNNDFQISIVTLDPGNKRPLVSTAAYEFLYMIEGEVKFHLDDTVLNLRKGDSLFFDGRIKHAPFNQQKSPVQYLVIYFFVSDEEEV
ncbi:MAG: XRE family transcriptional regulator [Flavobacteriales bacterium]|jgi:transcriptional regulator with XRE-family HTH domain|nr:XRE family transcriptional regulator [Flavobacteriales bacterium]